MKRIVFLAIALFPVLALADDPISNADAIQKILAELSSHKLVGMGLVAAAVQVIMIALRSELVTSMLGKIDSSIRLALVLGLTWLGGVTTMMAGGMTFGAALLHSTSLAAFQVFAHQLYTVYIEKKTQKVPVA